MAKASWGALHTIKGSARLAGTAPTPYPRSKFVEKQAPSCFRYSTTPILLPLAILAIPPHHTAELLADFQFCCSAVYLERCPCEGLLRYKDSEHSLCVVQCLRSIAQRIKLPSRMPTPWRYCDYATTIAKPCRAKNWMPNQSGTQMAPSKSVMTGPMLLVLLIIT